MGTGTGKGTGKATGKATVGVRACADVVRVRESGIDTGRFEQPPPDGTRIVFFRDSRGFSPNSGGGGSQFSPYLRFGRRHGERDDDTSSSSRLSDDNCVCTDGDGTGP